MQISVFLLLLLISSGLLGQANHVDNCYLNKDSRTAISVKSYPFNKANKILLVSYNPLGIKDGSGTSRWDTVKFIPQITGWVDTLQFIQKCQLTKKGVDSLLNIINMRSRVEIDPEAICVKPSNAIVFLDKNNKVLEYIALTFAEQGANKNYSEQSSSNKVNLGNWCQNKERLLLDFFTQRGISITIAKQD